MVILGGYSNSNDAEGNQVSITGGTVTGAVYGGSAVSGNVTNNSVVASGGTVEGLIYGGLSDSGAAKGNVVSISGGNVGTAVGGAATNAEASNNTIRVSGGNFTEGSQLYGGYSNGGNAMNNAVIFENALVASIFGGISSDSVTSGETSNNVIEINGGTITGGIAGGNTYSNNALNNVVRIYNSPILAGANLYGGHTETGTSSGNTLEIHTKGLSANNIYDFQNLDFYIPSTAVNGDTMLTLTDSNGTDLSNVVSVRAGVMGGSSLESGDNIDLLKNEAGITTSESTKYGKLSEGISNDFDLTIAANTKSLTATITVSPNTPTITASASNNTLTVEANRYTVNKNDAVDYTDTVNYIFGGRSATETLGGFNIIGGEKDNAAASSNVVNVNGAVPVLGLNTF